MQVFEEWATRRWESLPDAERAAIRASLLEFYVAKYATLAPFVANKIAKVLSDIGMSLTVCVLCCVCECVGVYVCVCVRECVVNV